MKAKFSKHSPFSQSKGGKFYKLELAQVPYCFLLAYLKVSQKLLRCGLGRVISRKDWAVTLVSQRDHSP